MEESRTAPDREDLLSLSGPGAGLIFALAAWRFYLASAAKPGSTALVFLIAALAWAAAWGRGPRASKERLARALLASTLAAGAAFAAVYYLPGALASFPCGAAAAALLCLSCGADEKRRRFSFVDALVGAGAMALAAVAVASMRRGAPTELSGLSLEAKLTLAAVSGGCALAAWRSVLYLVRGLELGLPLGTEHAASATAGFAAAVLLHSSGTGVLVVVLTAAPVLVLAASRGLRRLGRRRADAAMEGGAK